MINRIVFSNNVGERTGADAGFLRLCRKKCPEPPLAAQGRAAAPPPLPASAPPIVKHIFFERKTTMKQKEKTLDIALLIGAAVSVIIAMTTGFVKNCEEMQDKAFRLHILANSDSAADQQIKYEVRDYILSDLSCIFDSCDTKDETKALAQRNIGFITERVNDYLKLDGCEYRAVCTVEKCRFGTRKYGDYTLPAGEYDALKITLGKGEGNNWWCVLFPSLCISAASEPSVLPQRTLYKEEKRKAQLTADSLAARFGDVEYRFMLYEWFKDFFGV